MITGLLAALLLQSTPMADGGGIGATRPAAQSQASLETDAVAAVLDRLHETASRGDGPAYFSLFAPDARFVGTDATEHWSLSQFRAYADPVFAQGRGWTYHPRDRTIALSGDVAWFDEILDHETYGALRGSGVLRRSGPSGEWKIEQYVLSFAVPNDQADAVVSLIRPGPVSQ